MKRFFRLFCVSAVIVSVLCFEVSAESYGSNFPSYCPINGGAWSEISTEKGTACIVLRRSCISDIFGFYGSTGYDLVNVSESTVSGMIYFQSPTDYYGSPSSLSCRFQSFGTLEVYVPYSSNYGIRYEWQAFKMNSILNTNIDFKDEVSDRYNNDYVYSVGEKQTMIIICLLIGLILYFILTRCWHA